MLEECSFAKRQGIVNNCVLSSRQKATKPRTQMQSTVENLILSSRQKAKKPRNHHPPDRGLNGRCWCCMMVCLTALRQDRRGEVTATGGGVDQR